MEAGAKVDSNSSNNATVSGAEATSSSLDKAINEGVVRNSPDKVDKVVYYQISDDSSSDCSDLEVIFD